MPDELLRSRLGHFVQQLGLLKLAYLHIVEPRISDASTIEAATENDAFLSDAFQNSGAVILAGGFTVETAGSAIESHSPHRVAIAFGRHFFANPDLSHRIANGIEFNKYNWDTFYTPKDSKGYFDYPFSSDFIHGNGM